jgi:hypothetical protein
LFYNRYSNFFKSTKDITYYNAGELYPLMPGGTVPKQVVFTYVNRGTAWGIGGEIGFDISITNWLLGMINYSYQQITDDEDSLTTYTVNEKDRIRPENPKNKVNAGLRMKLKRNLSANILVHWRDRTQRLIKDIGGNEFLIGTDDYTIINTRLGYVFWQDNAELSLSVFNLFNDKHYEYPPGWDVQNPVSDRIGRKIVASLSYKFS